MTGGLDAYAPGHEFHGNQYTNVSPAFAEAAHHNKEQHFGLAAHALARGMTVPEFRTKLEATMKADLAESHVWIRSPAKALAGILKDGYKPVSESGHTQAGSTKKKPGDDGKRTTIADYTSLRREAEHAMFGIGAPPPEAGSETHRNHGKGDPTPLAHDRLPAHVHLQSYPDSGKPSNGVLVHSHDVYHSYGDTNHGDGRMVVDHKLWEQHHATGPRPVYGYASSEKEGGLSAKDGSLDQYGDMAIRLKPHVRERTTVTFGDSLDNAYMKTRPKSEMLYEHRDAQGHYTSQQMTSEQIRSAGVLPHVDAAARMTPSLIDHPSAFSINHAFNGRRQRDDVDTTKPTQTPEMGPATMGAMYSKDGKPFHLKDVLEGNKYERLTFHTREEALAADAKYLREQLAADAAAGHHGKSDPLVRSPLLADHYIEAQVHGGVKASDIAEVILADHPTPAVAKKLKTLGIPYTVHPAAAEKFANEKISDAVDAEFNKVYTKIAGHGPYSNRRDTYMSEKADHEARLAANALGVKLAMENPWIQDKAEAAKRHAHYAISEKKVA